MVLNILYMLQMWFFIESINNFKKIGSAQTIKAKINFQEELFDLKQSGRALPNRTRRFVTPTHGLLLVC